MLNYALSYIIPPYFIAIRCCHFAHVLRCVSSMTLMGCVASCALAGISKQKETCFIS